MRAPHDLHQRTMKASPGKRTQAPIAVRQSYCTMGEDCIREFLVSSKEIPLSVGVSVAAGFVEMAEHVWQR